MTKNALIKQLQKIPGNPTILLSSDSEGNSWGILNQIYTDEGEGMRFGYSEGQDGPIDVVGKEDIDEFFTQKDYNKYKECIILFPS